MTNFSTVAELPATDQTRVYVSGWQSWTPARDFGVGERPLVPVDAVSQRVNWRGDAAYGDGFQGDGLLAVTPEPGGPVHLFVTADARTRVPVIRARAVAGRLVITADGPVEQRTDPGTGGLQAALGRWADGFALAMAAPAPRRVPTLWCSWYHYGTTVTGPDILDNACEALARRLPIEVIQLDDGYQAGYGDWLVDSRRFGSTRDLIARIRDLGLAVGIWTAPFLVGARSALTQAHPDWLVQGDDGAPVSAGFNWGQDLYALDVTHPGAAGYLREVYATLGAWGVGLHKLDFLYAGALPGRRHLDVTGVAAYRHGLSLIREWVADAWLLACGAPLLPSVGLVDAMRVSCDTARHWLPGNGDLGAPSMAGAIASGRARAFMQGRFWCNDADCLLAGPEVPRREDWAAHVRDFGGARGSSDRLADLDAWGEESTREFLAGATARVFVG